MTKQESGHQKRGRRQEQAKPKPEQSEPGGLESNMRKRGQEEQKEYRKEYAPRVHDPDKAGRGREGTDEVPETRKVEREAEEAEKEARHKEQRDAQKQVQQEQKDKDRREKKAANQI